MITKAWFLFLMCWKWASIVTPIEEVIILGPFSKMHEESFFPYKKKRADAFKNEIPQGCTIKFSTALSLCIPLKRFTLWTEKKKAFEMRGSCFKAL